MKKKKISFQKAVEETKKEEVLEKEELKIPDKEKIEEKTEKKPEKEVNEIEIKKEKEIKKEEKTDFVREKEELKTKRKGEAVMGIAIMNEYYAIPIEDVVEITEVKIVPAPEMPEFLDGITEIRGKIIPVLDPAIMLGIGKQVEGKVILVDIKGELVGLKVTEIIGMIKIKGRKIYSLPEPLSKIFLSTAFEFNGKIFGIIELSNLLRDEYLLELKKKEK